MGKAKTKPKRLPEWMFHEPEWHEFGPEKTGLPATVWVDASGDKHPKNLQYIRFSWNSIECLEDSLPMAIGKDPYVPGWPCKGIFVDERLVAEVREFVIKNRKTLTDVGLGKIGLMTFEEKLKESVSGE